MKVTSVIAPIGTGEQVLSTSFNHAGKCYMLTSDFAYAVFPLNETKDNPRPKEIPIVFNKTFRELKYEYENNPDVANEQDKTIEALLLNFWGIHPMLTISGKRHKHTKVDMFNMVDSADKAINDYGTWQNILEVANTINGMSYTELQNAGYFYGTIPTGKSEKELKLILASFNDGIATRPQEINSFVKTFIKKDNKKHTEYTINARKALTFGIIQNKITDGNRDNFYIGDRFLGVSFNDIISDFKNDERTYEQFIVKKINEQENISAAIKDNNQQNGQPDKKSSLREYTELMEEADALCAEGFLPKGEYKYYNIKEPNVDKLRDYVIGARARKAAVMVTT